MTSKKSEKRRKRKVKGGIFAYIDHISFLLFIFSEIYFVYTPFLDAFSPDASSLRTSHGGANFFVGWIFEAILGFMIYRFQIFNNKPEKKKLKQVSFWFFFISMLMLFFSIILNKLYKNYILHTINGSCETVLMNRLYTHYIFFAIYALIRWIFRFDYYEYYYYEKGEKFNLALMYRVYFAVIALAISLPLIIKKITAM